MNAPPRRIWGRSVVRGVAAGRAIVSPVPIVWSHGVDPSTGTVVDVRVPLRGESVSDRIFVYPYGKGSTTSSTWLLEAIRRATGPRAIVNQETELIVAAGAVLGELLYGKRTPVIDRLDTDPLDVIGTGDWVTVNGDEGFIEITKFRP